jgi:hypothetical protein
MDEKIQAIKDIIAEARNTYDWGGGENEDGSLQDGPVDFDELEKKIIHVLEGKGD